MPEKKFPNRFRVIEAYRCSKGDPIVLHKGEAVTIGPLFEGDPEWPDWIWCPNAAGQGGWVPETLVARVGAAGRAREARELSAKAGEILIVSRILNG